MVTTKNICYRGGIAHFDIPNSWKEEYEPEGGATFYGDDPNSGTLRLNVISFESRDGVTPDEGISSLIVSNGYNRLQNDLAIKHYTKSAMENGSELQIHFWEVAVPVNPNAMRLAVFSYTIEASAAADQEVRDEITFLEQSIRLADYSREPGISGDYRHKSNAPVDYATPSVPGSRFSALALISLGIAIISNPILLKSVIQTHFSRGMDGLTLLLVVMGLSPILAIVAVVRIWRSKQQLRGMGIAMIALCISLLWLGFLLLLALGSVRG